MHPLIAPADVPDLPIALPYPPDLPAGLSPRPRVLLLIDADAVSHGLVDDTPRSRASNREMRMCLDLVHATARSIDQRTRVRCAASTATAAYHLDMMTESAGNTWLVRRGLDGADQAVLEELNHLIHVHRAARRRGRNRRAEHAFLVLLVAQDHIYFPAVRQLRLLGVPTWLLVPGLRVAANLYSAACAVTFIGPRPRLNISGPDSWPRPGSPVARLSGRES
jgi:hypothetical protein